MTWNPVPPHIKILQYTLYDLPVRRGDLPAFMADSFKLIEENEKAFKGISDPLSLFHNRSHKYSGIQFGIDDGTLSVRAYGEPEITALKIWWKLHRKKNGLKPANLLTQKELYTLGFLPVLQTFKTARFLVNREKQRELSQQLDTESVSKILADYLVANFFPFFNHLGYRHDRAEREIVANVLRVKRLPKPYTVFKGAKRQAYDIVFETNLRLPRLFRMGEATALGFGNVYRWK